MADAPAAEAPPAEAPAEAPPAEEAPAPAPAPTGPPKTWKASDKPQLWKFPPQEKAPVIEMDEETKLSKDQLKSKFIWTEISSISSLCNIILN